VAQALRRLAREANEAVIPPRPRDPIELGERAMTCHTSPSLSGFAPEVVIAIAVRRGHGRHLDRCFASIAAQSLPPARLGIVVLLDTNGPTERLDDGLPADLCERTWWLTANCGNASRARNALLDFVDAAIPAARWVVRLDDDDRFHDPRGIERCVELGEARGAMFVLAGNRVVDEQGDVLRDNMANTELLDPGYLVALARRMADGSATNELPSCNLLLRTGAGWRYPEFPSAEDHWLVAGLLFHSGDRGVIAAEVCLVDYTLDGPTTALAKRSGRFVASRQALAAAIATWIAVRALPGRLLGWGNEGVVREWAGSVHKHFYPGALDERRVESLRRAVQDGRELLPPATWHWASPDQLVASYAWEDTAPLERATTDQVAAFLLASLRARLVCANIKRSNFRVRADGRLLYIDLGDGIVPMDASYFLDAAARLFSIAVLGRADAELLRRPTDRNKPKTWEALPGFAEFYGQVMRSFADEQWAAGSRALPVVTRVRRADVTLLVKACAMDVESFREQAIHIVDQLVGPGDFAERVLLVDPHPGPYLRQHAPGDLGRLFEVAEELVAVGVFDRLLVAPDDPGTMAAVNGRWFGMPCPQPRSVEGVPIGQHLWGFEQVRTRYLLQADADVLVGRRDPGHDVVADMVAACAPTDVVGVASNIARPASEGWRDYEAPPGRFVPEVRLGLLDLDRVKALRPWPNEVREGQLQLTWYRSLERLQQERGLRTVRGGDPRTFYVHPGNDRKGSVAALARVRDLVAQGRVPPAQVGAWDLTPPDTDWRYADRREAVVVVALGRDTTPDRVARFAAGLACQTSQAFGVVAVDDAPRTANPRALADALHFLGPRCTLARTPVRQGRMANLAWVMRTLCTNLDSVVVIVDLDDALMDQRAIADVESAAVAGHDLVLAAPFRPDAPLKLYPRTFHDLRSSYGGNVWMHLAAFRRGLFDRIPAELLRDESGWQTLCTDYATMVPMARVATRPLHLPCYLYWHERTTVYDEDLVCRRDRTILGILGAGPSEPAGSARPDSQP
jgi:hypothetical protein